MESTILAGQFASLFLFFWQFLSYAGKLKYNKSVANGALLMIALGASGFIYLTFLV